MRLRGLDRGAVCSIATTGFAVGPQGAALRGFVVARKKNGRDRATRVATVAGTVLELKCRLRENRVGRRSHREGSR